MYKQIKTENGLAVNNNVIRRISDGACIPFDPQNVDYIAYLKYIAEGGVVLPADQEGVAP